MQDRESTNARASSTGCAARVVLDAVADDYMLDWRVGRWQGSGTYVICQY